MSASQILRSTLDQTDFHPHLSQQRRLYEAARAAILQQELAAGSKLPSTRCVANELGIARNTVIAAFKQLAAEGYVSTMAGSGTFISETLPETSIVGLPVAGKIKANRSTATNTEGSSLSRRGLQLTAYAAGARFEIQPFAPGDPDFSLFPLKLWQRIQNRVWREARPELLDYGQAGGYLPLRSAVAEYLRASRSVNVSVEQVMITSGTQQSLDLCAQMLADVGDIAWVEDPCYWAARRVFESCDLQLHAVAVDSDGIAPTEQDMATHPRLIYVTPSHQYPTGVVMTLARRRKLLDIAAGKRAWILEDDYDSEFRYTGRPLASLQGLDTYGRVVYMGTFSKILYPGIKVGYLVVPPALVEPFKTALYDLQRPGQMMVQAALADFISLGHFATHIRKIRQAYGAKRELLRKTLVSHMGSEIRISGEESGLHLVVELPDHVDDAALARLAAESGIAVKALSNYYLAQTPRRGLLIGYAYVELGKIAYYAKLLTNVIRSGIRNRKTS
ncbi:MAG TPA: PLP-dependent aminotransferase family protein [Burkholderiaceae bacterium]|jgi:GntR family transcriptional regulator/MocR family aminotransferase